MDDMRVVIQRHPDRVGQIRLPRAEPVAAKDRRDQPAAQRRHTFDRATGLAEDETGDMCSLRGCRTVSALRRGGGIEWHQPRAAEAIMRPVDRPVQNSDTNSRVAATQCKQNFLLEFWSHYPYHFTNPPALRRKSSCELLVCAAWDVVPTTGGFRALQQISSCGKARVHFPYRDPSRLLIVGLPRVKIA